MAQQQISQPARSPRLARLMELDASSEGACSPDELRHILRYRLSLPIHPAGSGSAEPLTFGDALRRSGVSVEVLRQVREFAQSSRRGADQSVPPEVSTLLYYASEAAGLVRHGRRLAAMDDALLARGLTWASRQAWAEDADRALCDRGLAVLRSSGASWPADPAGEAEPQRLPPLGEGDTTTTDSPTRRSPGDQPPPRVPGYEVTGRLGEGGMGTVWRAVQTSTRREVALKIVSPGALGSHKARQRFEREVELAARLEHPHIARVYDSGGAGGQFYCAMELVEGQHLDRYVREQKLSRQQVLALMKRVCEAVEHAHLRGVIHRDLKPANVMVTKDGTPKVLDFGLAKAIGEAAHAVHDLTLTQEGQFAGTPAFTSPEQAAGRMDRVDTRTDVYGLGATLYLLLTGGYAHDLSGPRYEALRRVATDDVRRPRLAASDLDPEIEVILLKALAHDSERRYASAKYLADDLDRYLNGEPLAARRPTLAYLARKRLRRHWVPVSVVAAVALVLVTAAAVFLVRESRLRDAAERSNRTALEEKRRAELALADAKVAEGDALLAADDMGRSAERYEQARQIQERLGASSFLAELGLWESYRRSPPPLLEFAGHRGRVNCAVFLPDGKRILSGSEDGTVRLWDALTGQTLRVFSGVGRVQRIATRPDGKAAAFAGMGRGVTAWDLATGERSLDLTGLKNEPVSVAWSPDGRYLLVGTTQDVTTADRENLLLFDAASGRLVQSWDGHGATVRAVAFSPDGTRAASCAGSRPDNSNEGEVDTSVCGWSVPDGRRLWGQGVGPASGRFTADVAFSPDGRTVLSGSFGGSLNAWDAASGLRRWGMKLTDDILGVAFSPAGDLAAATTADGRIELFSAPGARQADLSHTRALLFGGERSVSFSPDGQAVLAAAGNTVRLWPLPLADGAASRRMSGSPESVAGAVSPGNRLVLAWKEMYRKWGQPKPVTVYDATTGLRLGSAFGSRVPEQLSASANDYLANLATARPDEHATLAAFLPGGQGILLAEQEGGLGVWDPGLRKRLRALDPWPGHRAAAVAVSADGRYAAVRFWESDNPQLYDLSTGRRLRGLEMARGRVVDRMAFSPAGASVAAGSREGVVRAWDPATGRVRWSRQFAKVNCIAFSRDGRLLACGGGYELYVLDAGSGQTVTGGPWPEQVWSVAFAPDDRHVFAGGEQRDAIVLWEYATGTTRRVSRLPTAWVFDWAFSPDGTRLLVSQGAATVMDLSYPAAVRHLLSEVRRAQERLERDGGDGEALATLGRWYAARGAWGRAAEAMERARRTRADVPPLLLGRCYWAAGDARRARPEFQKAYAAALAAGNAGEAAYAELCVEATGPEEAARASARLRQDRLNQLGKAVFQAPWAERHRLIDATARDNPDLAAELRQLRALVDNDQGYRWAEQGLNLEEAKRLIEVALEVDPVNVNYLDSLGWVFYKLGRFNDAVEWLTKAAAPQPAPGAVPEGANSHQTDSEIPGVLDHLGDALWRADRRDQARAAWRRAAEQAARSPAVAAAAKAKLTAAERRERPTVAPTATEQAPATRPAGPLGG